MPEETSAPDFDPEYGTRAEHMAWAKSRALALLDAGDPHEAFASIISDLIKHPATAKHSGIELGYRLKLHGFMRTAEQTREFIEGFN